MSATRLKVRPSRHLDEFTPVIFRKDNKEITAVFPCDPGDSSGRLMSCYAHIGQHSACSWAWYNSTKPATPAEYVSLQTELESIGYTLKIYRRVQHWMTEEMHRAARG